MKKKLANPHHTEQDFVDLCKVMASISNTEDMQILLEDLCTPAEIEALSDRLKVAKLLDQELPYRTIAVQTGVSVTTVTRVARCLNGKLGGYRKIIPPSS